MMFAMTDAEVTKVLHMGDEPFESWMSLMKNIVAEGEGSFLYDFSDVIGAKLTTLDNKLPPHSERRHISTKHSFVF